MSDSTAFQDRLHHDNPIRGCFGCGADNPLGLQLKSFIEGDESIARWRPQQYHCSYPGVLNGGIASMLVDCHSACSAAAFEYRERGLDPGLARDRLPGSWTRAMNIEFLKPTPTDTELTIRARVIKRGRKSRTVACSIYANGEECVKAEVVVVIAGN